MKTPKVSVIIPIYNASKFLYRCCKALFGQTLDDIEFVFVDDCSIDDSINVINYALSKFPSRKNRTKLIRLASNMGVAYARQVGLENCTGEYVIHCDADDWAEKDMYATMYNCAQRDDYDIVVCDYIIEEDVKRRNPHIVKFPNSRISTPSFSIEPIEGAVWNKLIRRKLIVDKKLHFAENIQLGEDFLFVTQARILARKSLVIHSPFYHYNQINEKSITHNYSLHIVKSLICMTAILETYLIESHQIEEYKDRIIYLKFQSKQLLVINKEIRNLRYWIQIFPETRNVDIKFPIPIYLRFCYFLLDIRVIFLAKLVLTIKDQISKRIN